MTNRSSALHVVGVAVLSLVILIGCGGDDVESTDSGSNSGSTNSGVSATGLEDVDSSRPLNNDASSPTFHPEDNPELLSSWGQLDSRGGVLDLAEGVTPYTLNSALFSDHAQKLRTVWLPEGAAPATYESEAVLEFPVGTVITKTFYYSLAEDSTTEALRVRADDGSRADSRTPLDLGDVHLVETRVLAHRESGWVALPYVWNDEQTEATLARTGDLVKMTFVADPEDGAAVDLDFPYLVPNVNQCAGCHATNHTTKLILPIGPKARHLNTDVDLGNGAQNQLDQWVHLGLLSGMPSSGVPKATVWDDDSASLDDRARAYLDINCSHCHNQNGPADTSGLFLEPSTDLGTTLGVCKPPVAAGTGTGDRRVGIHPGEPEDSIFVFRMQSSDPGAMMPELGRAIVHQDGVDLITEWIESLDGSCS